jgi:hypothetical protein
MCTTVISFQRSVVSYWLFLCIAVRQPLNKQLTTDHCSPTTVFLPARFHDTGNFSLERKAAETQTANAELPQEPPRTSAELAPVVLAAAELRLPRILHSFCSSCHKSSSETSDQPSAISFQPLLSFNPTVAEHGQVSPLRFCPGLDQAEG